MKYVLLLCFIGLVASVRPPFGSFTESYEGPARLDEREIIEKFNELFNKLSEDVEKGRHFTIDTFLDLVSTVREMRDRQMNYVALLKERINIFSDKVKDAIVAGLNVFGIHIGGTQSSDIHRIDQDEIVKGHIDRFNKIVDRIIEGFQNSKILRPELMLDMIAAVNKLREHHVNWVNLMSDKLKDIRGAIRDRIVAMINMIKTFLGGDDEKIQHASIPDTEELIAKKEEIKKQMMNKIDQIIEKLRNGKLFGLNEMAVELGNIFKSGMQLGMDIDTLVTRKVRDIGGSVGRWLKAVVDWAFFWTT